MPLGRYPDVSLSEARTKAKRYLGRIADGGDPAIERQRALATERAKPTVTELMPRWLASVAVKQAATTHSGYASAAEKYLLPAFGRMRVADVERRHVARLHEKMKDTPIAANRTLAAFSVFMSFCEREGARAPNSTPCHGITRYKETKRQRFLTHDEMVRLGHALAQAERDGLPPSPAMQRKAGGMSNKRRAKLGTRAKRGNYKPNPDRVPTLTPANVYSVAAIRLMLLTGWRMDEVISTRWADIDFEHRTVIHHRTKGGKTARALNAPALNMISGLPRVDGSPWVFPRLGDPAQHMESPARLWSSVRHAAGLDHPDKAQRVMQHDLRHSTAAVAASSGASMPVIASLLGHASVATTDRYTHLRQDVTHEVTNQVGAIIAPLIIPRQANATTNGARGKSGELAKLLG